MQMPRVIASSAVVLGVVVGLPPGPGSARGIAPIEVGQPARPRPGQGFGLPARDAEEPESGTARIAGRVVAADTGRPLRRVVIRARSERGRGGRLASTDEEGRYEIPDLPAGSYTLTASKGGYVDIELGQRHPLQRGTPLDLRDGEARTDVHFSLPRGGVITGNIVDEFGEPVADAQVMALTSRFIAGERRLVPGSRDETDDIGAYRLFGLAPGEYVVSAAIPTFRGMQVVGDDAVGYAATYYPGTPSAAEAHRVTVVVGQEVAGVAFSLMPVAMARVSGRVLNSTGESVGGALVQLGPADGPAIGGMGGNGVRSRNDGTFTIPSVAPGRYQMLARSGGRGRGGELAIYLLTVGGADHDGLVLTTSPGASASGGVVVAGGASPTFAARTLRVEAVTTLSLPGPIGGTEQASVADDWTFRLDGLFGPRLVRVSGLPDGWVLEAVRIDGTDITDTPVDFWSVDPVHRVEVVVSSSATTITGTVTDGRGAAVADYTVIAFADRPDRWGFRSRFVATARAKEDGSYVIAGLPPERYLAVALPFVEQGAWTDPAFLERLRVAARPFDLTPGGRVALTLELSADVD